MALTKAFYRLKQFWFGLTARYKKEDETFARQYLTIQEMSLFNQLPTFEKKHSVVVARKMLRASHHYPDLDARKLARLGLLHDIGKVLEHNTLLTKALLVLIRFFLPKTYNRMAAKGQKNPRFSRFYIHRHHGEIGAHLLEKIGVSGEILAVIAKHDPHLNPLNQSDSLEQKILNQADSTY